VVTVSEGARPRGGGCSFPNLSFNTDGQLFVEPYLDKRVLLQETKNQVYRGKEDFSAIASSIHRDVVEVECCCGVVVSL
jgi:hypothetical protein